MSESTKKQTVVAPGDKGTSFIDSAKSPNVIMNRDKVDQLNDTAPVFTPKKDGWSKNLSGTELMRLNVEEFRKYCGNKQEMY